MFDVDINTNCREIGFCSSALGMLSSIQNSDNDFLIAY